MSKKVYSAVIVGIDAHPVEVETDLSFGLHSFSLVGLPDASVKESKERISAAIKNSGASSPASHNRKIIVNLAPADLRKEGPLYDLPIAMSFLLASEQVRFDPAKKLFVGELGLDGAVRRVAGVLPTVIMAAREGFEEVIIPRDNMREASLVPNITLVPVSSLRELIEHLEGTRVITGTRELSSRVRKEDALDFREIKGQESAKRALEIAAAGSHNILLSGPPGSGKSLLAKALSSILPDFSEDEMIEVTKIYSVAGALEGDEHVVNTRPVRMPHHTSSHVALIGGGANIRPGEITLAHRGVLFLDEFPEFSRQALESLREPLEEGRVVVSRASGSVRYPARFMLVAAMNPCPCGFYGDEKKDCICTPAQVSRYKKKISGPLLDRIDIHIEVPNISHEKLREEGGGEPSAAIQERVMQARARQTSRYKNEGMHSNAELTLKTIKTHCALDPRTEELFLQICKKYDLSARAYHRILRVARTIADLAGSETIESPHVLEAVQLRIKAES